MEKNKKKIKLCDIFSQSEIYLSIKVTALFFMLSNFNLNWGICSVIIGDKWHLFVQRCLLISWLIWQKCCILFLLLRCCNWFYGHVQWHVHADFYKHCEGLKWITACNHWYTFNAGTDTDCLTLDCCECVCS